MNEYEKFLKQLEKHPKTIDNIERKEQLEEFKSTYQIEKRTRLCCPVCTHGWDRGILYQSISNPRLFVCLKCKLTFLIELPGGNEAFLSKLDEEHKKKKELSKKGGEQCQ